MSAEASGTPKSQLDKLGSRLRNSIAPDDDDLVLLDQYRERFKAVNDAVVRELGKLTTFAIESRHKSVPSIVAKLRRRQPARLSAIQDLAGARIIVPGLRAQDDLVEQLVAEYPDATVDDKRDDRRTAIGRYMSSFTLHFHTRYKFVRRFSTLGHNSQSG